MVAAEAAALEKSRARYWARWRAAVSTSHESDTAVGRQMLGEAVAYLRGALDPWMDKAARSAGKRHSALEVFELLPDRDLMSLLIIRAVVDGISTSRTVTSLAMRVGSAIEQEYRLRDAETRYPGLVATLTKLQYGKRSEERRANWVLRGFRDIREAVTPQLPQATRLRAGAVALELLRQSTGLIDYKYKLVGKKKIKEVVASPSFTAWLDGAHLAHELLRPLLPPLRHPPVDWTAPDIGGYVTLPLTLVKRGREQLNTPEIAPGVYAAINRCQATPWRVNKVVHAVMEEAWERNQPLGGLPTAELAEMPAKPADIDTNADARRRYSQQASWIRSYRNSEKSRRIHVAQLLAIARDHLGSDLWMPMTLDFRGRMYAAPAILSPQASTFARSLLMFAEGKPLRDGQRDGTADFMRYGAGLFGVTGTLQHREEWPLIHKREIMTAAAAPLSCYFWQEAAEPWPFLAWCLEAADYWEDPEGFRNHLPIQIDASCNGCQIWALLLGDETTAKATNVYPNSAPEDLYAQVAARVTAAVKADSTPYGVAWATVPITRALVKQAVMIIPYSATLSGMGDAIRNSLLDISAQGKLVRPSWDSGQARVPLSRQEGARSYARTHPRRARRDGMAEACCVGLHYSQYASVVAAPDRFSRAEQLSEVVPKSRPDMAW